MIESFLPRLLSLESLFERLACASLIVRDRVPADAEDADEATIAMAFTLLDWGRDQAPSPALRKLAADALAKAVVPRRRRVSAIPPSPIVSNEH